MKPHDFDPEMLARPHGIRWCADIYAPSGDKLDEIPVEDGSVTLKGRTRNRVRGDLTLVDVGGVWDPEGFTGASPYGGHLQVCAVVAQEEVYVAGGLILEVTRQRPDGTIRVAFVDYGVAATWDQLAGPWTFAAGAPLKATIEYMMEMCRPTATIVDPGVPTTLPVAFTEERSREGVVASICADADIVAWMDEQRRLRLQPEAVTPEMVAVYTLRDGPTGTVTSEAQTLSRDGVPSFAVVTGEQPQGSTDPVWGLAEVTTGPFATSGPYGRVVELYNRPVLTTSAQCAAAGNTILAREARIERSLVLGAVAHPALEPGDRVDTVLDGNQRPMVIEELRFNIGPDAMTVGLVTPEATSS